jgi:class 3 adenylate cyclase
VAGETAETRYAKSGELSIAYQAVGEGPPDVVLVLGFVSHVELDWETPPLSLICRRIASFGRLIVFDKRGIGLSDRTERLPTLEERMDDIRAVMDAAGSERAAFIGLSEGAPTSLVFAATYPERVGALVLWEGYARLMATSGYEHGFDAQFVDVVTPLVREYWGNGRSFRFISTQDAPTDGPTDQLLGRYERNSATPSMADAAVRFSVSTDVRDVLPAISAPTLVVHRVGDPQAPIALGRYLADNIPGARFAEFPGDFHLSSTGADTVVLDDIQEFLTGQRQTPEVDRVLKTVLFTDIVGSTARLAELGDSKWKQRLDEHDAAVRHELGRFGGEEVKTTGDGFLATFDGPARAIRCAQSIGRQSLGVGVEVRAGLHTGECDVRGDDLAGMTVHIGARVADLAGPGEVLVTSTVRDLVIGSGFDFKPRGAQTLKGVPGKWDVLAVAN